MPRRPIPIQHVEEALLRWRGNVGAAAAELGVRRRTIYQRLEVVGRSPAAFRTGNGRGAMPKEQESELPVKAAAERRVVVRVTPAHQGRLAQARLDFMIRFRLETTENLILETFFEEAFDSWLREKLKARGAK